LTLDIIGKCKYLVLGMEKQYNTRYEPQNRVLPSTTLTCRLANFASRFYYHNKPARTY